MRSKARSGQGSITRRGRSGRGKYRYALILGIGRRLDDPNVLCSTARRTRTVAAVDAMSTRMTRLQITYFVFKNYYVARRPIVSRITVTTGRTATPRRARSARQSRIATGSGRAGRTEISWGSGLPGIVDDQRGVLTGPTVTARLARRPCNCFPLPNEKISFFVSFSNDL